MKQTFKVPIHNLFYLLSYANEMPELIDSLADVDDELITYDFLVKRFNSEVRLMLSRGMVKNYVAAEKETSNISGRILINESMPSLMWRRSTIVCEKDEYTEDILVNQIVKRTLEKIYHTPIVTKHLRRQCYLLWEEIPYVSGITLSERIFTKIHFHRHNAHYKRIIHLAYLLFMLQLLSHKQGDWTLFTASLSDSELNRLFERFLFNFYKQKQEKYKVHGEYFPWELEGNKDFLPRMETDVSLTHKYKNEKIIIDAKFYQNIFQTNFNKESFHSHNMYQMFTYLQHQKEDQFVRGILIYPYNGRHIKEVYRYDDKMMFEVMTVNLGAQWEQIEGELLKIIE